MASDKELTPYVKNILGMLEDSYNDIKEAGILGDHTNPYLDDLANCVGGNVNPQAFDPEEIPQYCQAIMEITDNQGKSLWPYSYFMPESLKNANYEPESFALAIAQAARTNQPSIIFTDGDGNEHTININGPLSYHAGSTITHEESMTKEGPIPFLPFFDRLPKPLSSEAETWLENQRDNFANVCWQNITSDFSSCELAGEANSYLKKYGSSEISSLSDGNTGSLTPPAANSNEDKPKVKAAGLGGN